MPRGDDTEREADVARIDCLDVKTHHLEVFYEDCLLFKRPGHSQGELRWRI